MTSGTEAFAPMLAPQLRTRMATAEGRLTGPDGTLYARTSTPCFIFDSK